MKRISDYVGQATVRLHGLPIGTTLLLLNGSAWRPALRFLRCKYIPASAVERIEVVPTGSSAIYGSDALAGAVNIILRQNFSGLEINAKQAHAAGNNETDADLAGDQRERARYRLSGMCSIVVNFWVKGAPYFKHRFPPGPRMWWGCLYPGTVYSLTGQNLPGLTSPRRLSSGHHRTPTIQTFSHRCEVGTAIPTATSR